MKILPRPGQVLTAAKASRWAPERKAAGMIEAAAAEAGETATAAVKAAGATAAETAARAAIGADSSALHIQ
jgi:hypothetical protein